MVAKYRKVFLKNIQLVHHLDLQQPIREKLSLLWAWRKYGSEKLSNLL